MLRQAFMQGSCFNVGFSPTQGREYPILLTAATAARTRERERQRGREATDQQQCPMIDDDENLILADFSDRAGLRHVMPSYTLFESSSLPLRSPNASRLHPGIN